jgi:hypothetical protein
MQEASRRAFSRKTDPGCVNLGQERTRNVTKAGICWIGNRVYEATEEVISPSTYIRSEEEAILGHFPEKHILRC